MPDQYLPARLRPRGRIGDILIAAGKLTLEQLQEGIELQKRSGERLGSAGVGRLYGLSP
jgi:hypothetical protein